MSKALPSYIPGVDLEALGSDGLLKLAQAPGTDGARELLSCVRARLEKERRDIDAHPMRSDDLTKDVTHRARYAAALQWVLDLPDLAKAIIKRNTGGYEA